MPLSSAECPERKGIKTIRLTNHISRPVSQPNALKEKGLRLPSAKPIAQAVCQPNALKEKGLRPLRCALT